MRAAVLLYAVTALLRSRNSAPVQAEYQTRAVGRGRAHAVHEHQHPHPPAAHEAHHVRVHKPLRPHFRHPKAAFLEAAMDPHCAQGISDDTLTHCCQAECGECSDHSDVCDNKATNGRGSTCCPADMAGHVKSCEFAMAPCEIPASSRAATSIADLTSAAGTPNAGADCNKALPDEKARHLLATHFVSFPSHTTSATTASCGSYPATAEGLAAQAAACDKDNTCMGLSDPGGGGSVCGLVAGSSVAALVADTGTSGPTVYLKKEGSASQTYHFHTEDFTACSASCGTGTMTRTVSCKSSQGESATMGMCSLMVAMNSDALPAATVDCNTHDCP